jgi:hypothetical protein
MVPPAAPFHHSALVRDGLWLGSRRATAWQRLRPRPGGGPWKRRKLPPIRAPGLFGRELASSQPPLDAIRAWATPHPARPRPGSLHTSPGATDGTGVPASRPAGRRPAHNQAMPLVRIDAAGALALGIGPPELGPPELGPPELRRQGSRPALRTPSARPTACATRVPRTAPRSSPSRDGSGRRAAPTGSRGTRSTRRDR